MARDRRSHVREQEVPGAPTVAATGTSTAEPNRDKFLALIRTLAREAARADHESSLAKAAEPRHPHT